MSQTTPPPDDGSRLREKIEAAILAQGCLEEYEGEDRGRQWAHTAQTWLWPGDSVVVLDRQELVDAIMALLPIAATKPDAADADRARLMATITAIRAEAERCGEYNPCSGKTRLPKGYHQIIELCEAAMARDAGRGES